MLKRTMTYDDFNDEQVTEDFYFNLTKGELAKLELQYPGGFSARLSSLDPKKNPGEVINVMQQMIDLSYGQRSDDGKRFEKTPEMLMEFQSTNAYSDLFFELCTDAEKAAEFVNGIMPAKLQEAVAKMQAAGQDVPVEGVIVESPSSPEDTRPAYQRENREPTSQELVAMTQQELQDAFRWRDQLKKG